MRVECTAPWWHNRTLYKAGSVLEVPEGTSVPQGFIVDGKEVPRKPSAKQLAAIEKSKDDLIALQQARIAELELQAAAPINKKAPRPFESKPPKGEKGKEQSWL